MKNFTSLTSVLLLAAAVACSADPIFGDLEGSFISESRSKSGNYHVISSTMSTRVFLTQNGQVELLSEIDFSFKYHDKDIRGYPTRSAISDQGLLVVDIQGASLEAWQVDKVSKSASKLWGLGRIITKSIEFIDAQQKLLISTSGKLLTIDPSTGKIAAESEALNIVEIVETQDQKVVFLTRDALFTLPASAFAAENLSNLADLFKDTSLGLTNNPKISISGRSLLFPLHGLKANSDQTSHVLVYTVERGSQLISYTVFSTENLQVVNKFDSPHWFYDPENVKAISGTNLIMSNGQNGQGNRSKVFIIDALAAKFGYAPIIKTITNSQGINAAIHISGVPQLLLVYGNYKIEDATQSFKLEDFCAFKYCSSCKSLNSCDACIEGLEWNASEQKCTAKSAQAMLF